MGRIDKICRIEEDVKQKKPFPIESMELAEILGINGKRFFLPVPLINGKAVQNAIFTIKNYNLSRGEAIKEITDAAYDPMVIVKSLFPNKRVLKMRKEKDLSYNINDILKQFTSGQAYFMQPNLSELEEKFIEAGIFKEGTKKFNENVGYLYKLNYDKIEEICGFDN